MSQLSMVPKQASPDLTAAATCGKNVTTNCLTDLWQALKPKSRGALSAVHQTDACHS
jgi:hypothetical protein